MYKLVLLSFFYVIFFIFFLFGAGRQRPMMISSFQDESAELTFEKDIKPIMNSYCGGIFCHHGKPSIWTNYQTVKKSIDSGSFKEQVIEKKTMPKRKHLPQKEYDILKTWIEKGAKEK